MQTNLKESRTVGAIRLDKENSGKPFSKAIVPPQINEVNRRGQEPIGLVLARVYRLLLEGGGGQP
jgi:hypothetical protein